LIASATSMIASSLSGGFAGRSRVERLWEGIGMR
jgi:hypothetical protein